MPSRDPQRPSSAEMTNMLNRLKAGDEAVGEELWPVVYEELHKHARAHVADQRRGAFEPTALVHEAWLKLVRHIDSGFECRAQFFSLASKAMRSVLVDHARARHADKRGAGADRITLDEDLIPAGEREVDLVALDEALGRLADMDPELARLVELRFFGGLKHPEIAEVVGTSLRSVERSWRLARSWLVDELTRGEA